MSQEYLNLENRKVIKISGSSCVSFLNNILTSDISKLMPFETIPSTLLSPQGRVLFDMLVSLDFPNDSEEKSILIEHDLYCEDDLINKLSMYNLRKDVKIEKTSYNVLVGINPKSFKNTLKDKRFLNLNLNVCRIYYKNKSMNNNKNTVALNWYDLLRYKNCIPEGTKEIKMNRTLPLEMNLDLLGGISFEKGCFIGQEVNARIKYKGLIKKKYVPVCFKNNNFSVSNLDKIEKKIFLKTQDIGELIALILNKDEDIWYGIAKIKLSQLYLFEENNKLECDFYGSKMKIKFPKYMLPLPRKI